MNWRRIRETLLWFKYDHSAALAKAAAADLPLRPPPSPIFLFADSQLLFCREDGLLLAERIRALVGKERARAAYLQASGGDDPHFFPVFKQAMELVGVEDHRLIHPASPPDEVAHLETADIIFLAGEDVAAGWQTFEESGLAGLVSRRYAEGAVVVGLSAGSTQLGRFGWREDRGEFSLFETISLVPFIVGVRGEACAWESLKRTVVEAGGSTHGIGIPAGGGIIYYADRSIESLRHTALEVSLVNNQIVCSQLPPGILWMAADTTVE